MERIMKGNIDASLIGMTESGSMTVVVDLVD